MFIFLLTNLKFYVLLLVSGLLVLGFYLMNPIIIFLNIFNVGMLGKTLYDEWDMR